LMLERQECYARARSAPGIALVRMGLPLRRSEPSGRPF
jgi:hypothetical protein